MKYTGGAGGERPDFAFGRLLTDRADVLRDDPEALDRLWPGASVLLIDEQGAAVAEAQGESLRLYLPRGADCARDRQAASFLGLNPAGRAWFALAAERCVRPPPAGRLDLRRAAALLDPEQAGLFAYARALLHWQRHACHCSRCGAPLQRHRAGHLARCPACGAEFYPRTDPAVIVLVSDGERVLLGRQPAWPPRRYSVLAGFVEPGERLEDAVRREVMEEAGLRVHACEYVASQPWPFPAALMVGFRALAEPGPPRLGGELEDARWLAPAEVPAAIGRGELLLSPRISIARRLIEDWLEERGVRLPPAAEPH